MSYPIKARLRRMLIWLATMATLLGWATAAAAKPPRGGDHTNSGEPISDDKLTAEQLKARLPAKWEKPALLAQAAVEINSLMAQAENERQLIAWPTAEMFYKSLLSGKTIAEQIDPETRVAYYQALCITAMAAGYPAEALKAARELVKAHPDGGWNWLAVYEASMVSGDKGGCLEAVGKIMDIVGPAKKHMVEPLRVQTETIGQQAAFSISLSDQTEASAASLRGKVTVFDFWSHDMLTYVNAYPMIRDVYESFKDYADFRMIGINMSDLRFRTILDQFIASKQMTWPQYFEGRQGERAISFGVFKSRQVPSLAVVSPTGKIIYLGTPKPTLHYAIRAGLVEANREQVPTSQPGSADARMAKSPASKPPTSQPAPAGGNSEPADDPEAEKKADQKLKLAEAFEAAGAKDQAIAAYQEIEKFYPKTKAAEQARLRLIMLAP